MTLISYLRYWGVEDLHRFNTDYCRVCSLIKKYTAYVEIIESAQYIELKKRYNSFDSISDSDLVEILMGEVADVDIPEYFFDEIGTQDISNVIEELVKNHGIWIEKIKIAKNELFEQISEVLLDYFNLKNNCNSMLYKKNKNGKDIMVSGPLKIFFRYTSSFQENRTKYDQKLMEKKSEVQSLRQQQKRYDECLQFLEKISKKERIRREKQKCLRFMTDLFCNNGLYDFSSYDDIEKREGFYIIEIRKILTNIIIPSGKILKVFPDLGRKVELLKNFWLEAFNINNYETNLRNYDCLCDDYEFLMRISGIFDDKSCVKKKKK